MKIPLGNATGIEKNPRAIRQDGSPNDDVACIRGVASDMTMIGSKDFRRAKDALEL